MLNNDNQTINGKRLTLQQKAFLISDDGLKARIQLKLMVNNPIYNTTGTYATGMAAELSFVDRHMIYLSEHPKLSVHHYLSNLRLKTKKFS